MERTRVTSNLARPPPESEKQAVSQTRSSKEDDAVLTVNSAVSPEQSELTPPGDGSAGFDYPKGLQLALLTCGLMMVVLMVALDNYILATAIPSITSEFHSLNDVGWYGSTYFLTPMAFQPLYGKLYKHFHLKTVFLAAIVIFELGSTLCAAAISSSMFIVGRAVAGIGGGGLFVGTIVLIGYAVPVPKRPLYVSIVTSMYGVASVLGPILGGIFTDSERLTWRFCFWINLPVGAVSFLMILAVCRSPPREPSTLSLIQKLASLDFSGAILLISAFICLLLAMQWGGVQYEWSDSRVAKLKGNASLPLRLFSNRTVMAGFLYTTRINIAIGIAVYWIPVYYQSVLGFSAKDSGIRTIPLLTPLLLAPMISGFAISNLGYYMPFIWFSGLSTAAGLGLLIVLAPDTSTSYIIGSLVLVGFGTGSGRQIALSAFQHVLPSSDIPLASALLSFAFSLGSVLATCLSQAVFFNGFEQRLAMIPGITSGDVQKLVSNGATSLDIGLPVSLLKPARAACSAGIADTFIMGTAFAAASFVCSLGMKWANIKH